MDIHNKIWDRTKSDQDIFEMFQKIIRVNRVHNRSISFDEIPNDLETTKDDFFNFVSIIINPEQDSAVKKMILNLYEKMDINLLISYFYKENQQDFGTLNVESISKLKKIFDEVS